MRRVIQYIVMGLCARMAVIMSIAIAVGWGGVFHEPFDFVKGVVSWSAVWGSVEYYGWHINKFERGQK